MSLRKQLKTAQARMAEISDEIEAVGAAAASENRELTDEDTGIIDKLSEEFDGLAKTADRLTSAITAQDKIKARAAMEFGDGSSPQPGELTQTVNAGTVATAKGLPVRVRTIRSKFYENTADAYAVGMWLSAVFGNHNARQWCSERGMSFRNAMEGGTDNLGGYTVPDIMAATIIRLLENYGVYRRYARQAVMTSDTLLVPKRAGGSQIYYPAENQEITASDITFGQIQLIAKKYAQLSILSTELNEDSVISMVDLITNEFAYAFAVAEDTNSFKGDGGAGFAGITGIESALQAGAKVTVTGSLANGWGDVALGDLETMVAKLAQYSGLNPTWFMHSYGYYASVVSLLNQLGGTDMRHVEGGGQMMLMGYPVEFTQVLPGATWSASELVACIGDLDKGAYLGNRRAVTIKVLNELYAAQDSIGVQGTMRSDSVVHDVGDATNAGCIVGLYAPAT